MRRLLIPIVAATLLSTALSSPARAEGWKEYRDCLSFTMNWCLAAREGTNELEETAVDAACLVLLGACVQNAF